MDRVERYRGIVGQTARVPLFGQDVSIMADERADPEKGTGAVMCCTFGDTVDIEWWRQYHLPLREVLGRDGTLLAPLAGPFAGLPVRKARQEIVQALEGAIAPMECFVHDHTERVLCSHEPDAGRGCATKLLWTRVQNGIIRSLQTTTLAELVEFSRRTERAPAVIPQEVIA